MFWRAATNPSAFASDDEAAPRLSCGTTRFGHVNRSRRDGNSPEVGEPCCVVLAIDGAALDVPLVGVPFSGLCNHRPSRRIVGKPTLLRPPTPPVVANMNCLAVDRRIAAARRSTCCCGQRRGGLGDAAGTIGTKQRKAASSRLSTGACGGRPAHSHVSWRRSGFSMPQRQPVREVPRVMADMTLPSMPPPHAAMRMPRPPFVLTRSLPVMAMP